MPALLSIGTEIRSRYRIAQVIWETRLMNVYYVQDLHIAGKAWVIKEMQMVAVDDQDSMKMMRNFEREAQQLSTLSHPHLATVIDFFQEGKNLYIVREYVNGIDLDSLMKKNQKPFTECEVILWAIQIADLLSFLYSKKLSAIFFREFNVKNIIRTASGSVRLIDLGLARVFRTEDDEESSNRMGSMDYAAPEQFNEGGTFDIRSLVYSLGAFMYHTLTNVSPAASPFDLKPINILNPTISRKTQEIIKIATAIDPRQRFQSLTEMKKEIMAILKRPRGTGGKGEENGEKETGLLNWILGIVALITLGILIYYLYLKL